MASLRIFKELKEDDKNKVVEKRNISLNAKLNDVLKEIKEKETTLKSVRLLSCFLSQDHHKKEVLTRLFSLMRTVPGLTEIDLSGNELFDNGAETVANFICEPFANLNTLNLTDNWIKYSGAKALIDAVLSFPQQFNLILNGNNMSLAECQELGLLARRNPKLKLQILPKSIREELDITFTLSAYMTAWLDQLRIYPIKKLFLNGKGINDTAVKIIVDELKRSQQLYIEEVQLQKNDITEIGAACLEELAKLCPNVIFKLDDNQIKSQILEFKSKEDFPTVVAKLKVFPVQSLHLAYNVSEQEVDELARLMSMGQERNMKVLDLSETKLTDNAENILIQLKKKIGLQIILSSKEYKFNENLTGDKFYPILNKLSIYPVPKLNLSGCNLNDADIKLLINYITAYQSNTLTDLDLSNNNLTIESERVLAELKKAYPAMKIILSPKAYEFKGDYSKGNINDIIDILHLRPVTKLNLSNCGISEIKRIVEAIQRSQLASLTELDLSGNKINDEDAVLISDLLIKCPNLKIINLQNNNIGDLGASALAEQLKASHLKTLNLSGNRIFADGLTALTKAGKNHADLERLDLTENSVEVAEDEYDEAEDREEKGSPKARGPIVSRGAGFHATKVAKLNTAPIPDDWEDVSIPSP